MGAIQQAYKEIHKKAPNAAIIVAGYPKLLDKNGKGAIFSKNEAKLVNDNVNLFNKEIKKLVEASESTFHTYFVDVEKEFDRDGGHQAYSPNAWINPVIIPKKSEDIDDHGLPFSAYSIHPNEYGAKAYARCVNAVIEDIEGRKSTHTCTVSGVVTIADADTDMTNNLPLEGAKMTITGSKQYAATTDTNGRYQINNVPVGKYDFSVTREGFIPVSGVIIVSEDNTEIIYNVTIEAVSDVNSGIGYADGTVYDVGTGLGVSGLTLNVRSGIGVTTGNVILTTTTSADGTYDIQSGLDAGNYTVEVVDNRSGVSENEKYTTTSFIIKILGGLRIGNQHGYVSNGLTIADIRVVLRWGEYPLDLDSHLVGPTADGDSFHVYFANEAYEDEIDLDVDDIDSYGPETITIHKYNNGIYTYAVHDYSNRESSNSTELSTSGAQVQIYRGMELLMTYNVPVGKEGTLWTVFSYDSNTNQFSTINTMSYASYSFDVLQPKTYSELPLDEEENVVEDAQALIINDIIESKDKKVA